MAETQRAHIDDDEAEHTTSEQTETAPTPPPAEAVSEFVDARSGSGSLTSTGDWVRSNAREPLNDGRSPTRTYFDARDVNGSVPHWQHARSKRDQRSWEEMAHWQDGAHSDISRGGQNWHADKRRWVQTFGTRMGAKEYHVQRALNIIEHLELSTYKCRNSSKTTINAEIVIVGVLSLLIDADITCFENRALKRPGTAQLLDDLETDVGTYETVRTLLRQEDGDLLFPDS